MNLQTSSPSWQFQSERKLSQLGGVSTNVSIAELWHFLQQISKIDQDYLLTT